MPDRTLPTPKLRTYPLDAPADDPRFSFGLALDVAEVLAKHGYPELASGLDVVALEQALFGFLYRPVSASLGNQPAEYGRAVDNGDASAEVPTGVEGGPVTGRAAVPHIPCAAEVVPGVPCGDPIYWNAAANAWWHQPAETVFNHTATAPSVPPAGGE
jgi:hypothetical protein